MSRVKDLINECRAASEEGNFLEKQASSSYSQDSLSPQQLTELADRIEKASAVQEASRAVVEMRKAGQVSPQISDMELKKLAYRQALKEIGFQGGSVSPLNLLFGNMTDAQNKLSKMAADIVTTMISSAIEMGLKAGEDPHE